MKAKINEKILCIPPYISTQWQEVTSIHSEEDSAHQKSSLIINLKEGKIIKIENIEPSLRDLAFAAHLQYLEKSSSSEKNTIFQTLFGEQAEGAIPIRLDFTSVKGLPEGVEGMESAFHHNAAAQIPNLPAEVLEKVASIARIFMNGDLNSFPKPEPHCNCMHCQVAREIHKIPAETSQLIENEDVEVKEEELRFRTWDILQIGEQLFTVTDPTNPKLKFNVFLGSPIGCTCGDNGCEHIRAVLST